MATIDKLRPELTHAVECGWRYGSDCNCGIAGSVVLSEEGVATVATLYELARRSDWEETWTKDDLVNDYKAMKHHIGNLYRLLTMKEATP